MNDAARDAAALGNRVAKNVRHLKKWAKREGVSCYRVYDRDIPEVPVTIDWYEGRAVLHDVRTPYSDRDEDAAADWLDAVVRAAAAVLGPDIFVKVRERMAGRRESGRQYGRQDTAGARFEVSEGGHRFVVNLSDYLDTGLFLDHRITRARVGAESAGKHVLNLFCYTGSFSVYAAGGGAASTLSVDLSKTYLDWAADNFAINQMHRRDHVLRQGDVREVLDELERARGRFDLAVVDPPTFSNSARMDGTFDIQRDHTGLLAQVARLMEPGGVIWFSTNHRRFRFESRLPATEEHTIPPDFRDARVHRAWRITIPA